MQEMAVLCFFIKLFFLNRRNLARVDVYYKSMTTEIIQQVPRYEVNEDCIRKFYKVQKASSEL